MVGRPQPSTLPEKPATSQPKLCNAQRQQAPAKAPDNTFAYQKAMLAVTTTFMPLRIQKVKSGLAIFPADASQAAFLHDKAPKITAVLGLTDEKSKRWVNYFLYYIPIKISTLDGSITKNTHEIALDEIRFETGVTNSSNMDT
ncbi:hypothetical protein EPUL_004755 [Erysiphe pulchra]|uniref:Uncharacterized protein n=1 Tax=Erysiphe pulchra TaxID=225359 RepID=A0A2S4PRX4_9PEZI|nr:hypothetical protein EPUL_004755 [Erysiphe pulchra]